MLDASNILIPFKRFPSVPAQFRPPIYSATVCCIDSCRLRRLQLFANRSRLDFRQSSTSQTLFLFQSTLDYTFD